ncbi:MAG: hypothetical protein Q8R24_08850 [Legionellaceae bacterium]|nr:hypothetical protein [Legionellaceae bacterium]
MRRIVREFITPTIIPRNVIKPFALVIHHLFIRPVNFFSSLKKSTINSKESLYFFYDFEVEPITYDFAWALCIANAKREELGLKYLRVILVPGMTGGLRKEAVDYEQAVGQDARNLRIYSILIPITRQLICDYGVVFCATRYEALLIREKEARFVYPDKYSVLFPIPYSPGQAMWYQKSMLSLKADIQSLQYISEWKQRYAGNKKLVVITLRQYAYLPERNSNIASWSKFAQKIKDEDFSVIFVPDTEQALQDVPEQLKNFHFFQPACWNLSLRSALYELAYLNLGVNTGPMSLCWFNSRCAYITFKTTVENVPSASLEVMVDRGFVRGENPKFANAFQKWVWDDDDFDVIFGEFRLMCDVLDRR